MTFFQPLNYLNLKDFGERKKHANFLINLFTTHMDSTIKKRIISSLLFPVAFMVIAWGVFLFNAALDLDLNKWGILPLNISGLRGIIFSPFLHGDFSHLINNTLSFLALSSILFYFYRGISFQVFFLIYLISGVGTWLIGRGSYHIGASGIIYGLAFFIFLSGILRKHIGLMAISLLVTFLYGSMVWFLLPIQESISWEGHLAGAVAGVGLAFRYRHKGPQRKRYEWEFEEDDDDDENLSEEEWANQEIEKYKKEKTKFKLFPNKKDPLA